MTEFIYRVCTDTLSISPVEKFDLSEGFSFKSWYWNLIGDGHHAYFEFENEAKDALKSILQKEIQGLQEKLDSLNI